MSFKAQCPYCQNIVVASQEAIGSSARCLKCGDFFTVAPLEEEVPLPVHGPASRARARAAKQSQASAIVDNEPAVAPETTSPEGDTPPQAEPSSLQAAGVVGFFCGGMALLAASFPAWSWVTIPLSVVGLIIGGSAVVWVHVQRVPGMLVSAAGAVVSFLVLFVAVLLPGWLGPSYSTPRSIDAPPSAIQVIPLQLAQGAGPAADAEGYVDASRAGLQQGSVRIQVVEAFANTASKKHAAALTIRLRIHLLEDSKELVSKGLAFSGASGEATHFVLKDASGTTYTHKDVKTMVPDEKEARLSAFPTAVSDELIRFEPPPPAGQDLRFDVPAAAWGGNAVFRLLIPKNMIRSQP